MHAQGVRNREWFHLISDHVISMPDKWEYPVVRRLGSGLPHDRPGDGRHRFRQTAARLCCCNNSTCIQPGRFPAYEWNFSDVNPPVQAWAAIFLYRTEQALHGKGDLDFLKRVFGRLTANFGWWVNRKDRFGRNLFEGGFLGLDNIGVFDRSAPLPTGGHLEQADGTAWMALFCQNMLEIAIELAAHDPTYEELASTYTRCTSCLIARAMNTVGPAGHVGRGGRILLRRPAPARRQRDAAQGPLDGRSAAALRRQPSIEKWQRERMPELMAADCRTRTGGCRNCANPSMRPDLGTTASRNAAFWAWSTRTGCAEF